MNLSPTAALAEGVQRLRLIEKTSSVMMTPPPSEDKAPPSSQKSTSNHSDNETKHPGDDKTAYIESLKEERDLLTQHSNHFNHVFTLIDNEIKKLAGDEKSPVSDPTATLSEVIPVPVEEYPNYNFVGRILGPRGTTAKQLEASIGCKVTILGRVKKDGSNDQSDPTDNGPLRVQILCSAEAPDAAQRLEAGVSVIKALLIPPADGQDELKRQQLMVLANMNGTYRPRSVNAQPQYNGGAGDFGNHNQYQNLLPYGYRLPVLSKSQQEVNLPSLMGKELHVHTTKSECSNPKCLILRSLIEQNVPKNTVPKLDDVLGVMHMYELMNRIRLANSTIFGEPRHHDDMVKAQEIGNRMCSALSPGIPRSESSATPSTSTTQRRPYRPRHLNAKK